MIRGIEGLTAYLSKVKMTDDTKLKDREDKDKKLLLRDIE